MRSWNARPMLISFGALVGALAGTLAVALSGVAAVERSTEDSAAPFLEVTHLPPLLTAAGEPVELRFDVYCSSAGADPFSEACDAGGSVFVRTGDAGTFEEIPLAVDRTAAEGRYVAHLPDRIAASPDGFAYYAILRDSTGGLAATYPEAGPDAPQRSLPLGRSVDVRLGTHVFGATATGQRVARAAWGTGSGEIGLEQGPPDATATGAASFDVASNGGVTVLDEANRRLLRWAPGAGAPVAVPVEVNGTLADIAVSDDGTTFVLESTAGPGHSPAVRSFDAAGKVLGTGRVAERAASQIRLGPTGPVALEQPSGAWMPVMEGRRALDDRSQLTRGRAGRPLRGGGEVVVLRTGNEIRAAIVGPDGSRRSWRISSDTPIGEVQLAEPLGKRLVLVFRVYTDGNDEFVALVLDRRGVVRHLAIDSADWAETAPLSRFRVAAGHLYRLGSTSRAAFVDRFELGVK